MDVTTRPSGFQTQRWHLSTVCHLNIFRGEKLTINCLSLIPDTSSRCCSVSRPARRCTGPCLCQVIICRGFLKAALHLYVFFGTILMASCMYVDLLFFGLDLFQTKASSLINMFSQKHHDLTHPILPYVQNSSFHDIASGADHVRIQRHTSQSTLSV